MQANNSFTEDTASSNSADGHPPGAKRQQVTRHPKRKRRWDFGGFLDPTEKLPSDRKYIQIATYLLCMNTQPKVSVSKVPCSHNEMKLAYCVKWKSDLFSLWQKALQPFLEDTQGRKCELNISNPVEDKV